jgi:hypothetical protein
MFDLPYAPVAEKQWCLKVKIMIIEIASTGIFLAFVYAVAWHEVTLLLRPE